MRLFDVYQLLGITPVSASGCTIRDDKGISYLDLYGGHAVISIGHSHPWYIERITSQLKKLAFYSNSVQNPLQEELADKLGSMCVYPGFQLFLCNSGAEANENAIKLASFATGRKKFIAFSRGFHGRTSAAVALTDNPNIIAPVNRTENALILPFNDQEAVREAFSGHEIAGIIVEGIQGIGGIQLPAPGFLKTLQGFCRENGAMLILDEIQSGYGRTGKFFAHQYDGVVPDIITMAKGMGNGFPIGGLLISPDIKPRRGMLGTTFGGNHLACAAALAVLEIMEKENLIENALQTGNDLMNRLNERNDRFAVRGRGLMTGIEFPDPVGGIRSRLIYDSHIFTGISGTNTLRLLPPLCLTKEEAARFADSLFEIL